jgi:hypothetical protein
VFVVVFSTLWNKAHGWIGDWVLGSHSTYLNFKFTSAFTSGPFSKTSIPARVPRGGPTATRSPRRADKSLDRHRVTDFRRVVCFYGDRLFAAAQRSAAQRNNDNMTTTTTHLC